MTISFLWEIELHIYILYKHVFFFHGTCETKNQLCDGGTRTILSQTSLQMSISLSLIPLLFCKESWEYKINQKIETLTSKVLHV
jgi:hypothetical protein